MYTIIETPTFKEDADKFWTEEERGAFCSHLAANPEVDEVIPRSGGCRKIRWSKAGTGKRGGVRVVYFTRLVNGEIWLLVIYSKAVKENIPAHILKQIREALENE
jgi:mRNA-degrading endonuclease RelE of RelBE toxin-antitoxin system